MDMDRTQLVTGTLHFTLIAVHHRSSGSSLIAHCSLSYLHSSPTHFAAASVTHNARMFSDPIRLSGPSTIAKRLIGAQHSPHFTCHRRCCWWKLTGLVTHHDIRTASHKSPPCETILSPFCLPNGRANIGLGIAQSRGPCPVAPRTVKDVMVMHKSQKLIPSRTHSVLQHTG